MLPSDVLGEITKWLDLRSIIRLSRVNSKLNRFFQSQLKNQPEHSTISKTFHVLLTEMRSTYLDEYNAAAVKLQNENGDLKNGLCSLIDCCPSSSQMSTSDYIICIAYLNTILACCLLSLAAIVNLLGLIPNPDPNVKEDSAKKERIFDLSFLGIGLAESLMLAAAVACLGVALYRGMKSCQRRYTLFTSGRKIERYNRRISEMEKGRNQVVQIRRCFG